MLCTRPQSSYRFKVEIVGSVESGIKAAAWSPDDEQLVLVTGKLHFKALLQLTHGAGEDTLVCMTRSFDLVHEETLRSDQFGEGQLSHADFRTPI